MFNILIKANISLADFSWEISVEISLLFFFLMLIHLQTEMTQTSQLKKKILISVFVSLWKDFSMKNTLGPLISASRCRIRSLLSGACGCHSDEWGRNAVLLYHPDRKHRDRAREKSNGRRERGREERSTKRKQKEKMTMEEKRKSDSKESEDADGDRRLRAEKQVEAQRESMCVNTHSLHQTDTGTTLQLYQLLLHKLHISEAVCQLVLDSAAVSQEGFQFKHRNQTPSS